MGVIIELLYYRISLSLLNKEPVLPLLGAWNLILNDSQKLVEIDVCWNTALQMPVPDTPTVIQQYALGGNSKGAGLPTPGYIR